MQNHGVAIFFDIFGVLLFLFDIYTDVLVVQVRRVIPVLLIIRPWWVEPVPCSHT